MSAVLDLLEVKKRETFTVLREEEREGHSSVAKLVWLEEALTGLYRWAIKQSRGDLTVHEVFELWDKMVAVCDAFIDYVRDGADATAPDAFDHLLDLRLACDEKREFHRCS